MNVDLLLALPVLVLSVVAHEVAHAAAAYRQGDTTAYMLGRITLNPLKHIDPFLTVLMPLLLWFGSGGRFIFGAAKPVPVNPRNYRNYRRGDVIVSGAGIAANLALAVAATAGFAVFGAVGGWLDGLAPTLAVLQRMMFWALWLNLILAFFNLLPIPPLDGSHLFYHVLPPRAGEWYRGMHRLGFIPLLVLVVVFPKALDVLLTPAHVCLDLALRSVGGFALTAEAIPL